MRRTARSSRRPTTRLSCASSIPTQTDDMEPSFMSAVVHDDRSLSTVLESVMAATARSTGLKTARVLAVGGALAGLWLMDCLAIPARAEFLSQSSSQDALDVGDE